MKSLNFNNLKFIDENRPASEFYGISIEDVRDSIYVAQILIGDKNEPSKASNKNFKK